MARPIRPLSGIDPNQIRIGGFDLRLEFNGPLQQLTLLAERASEIGLGIELEADHADSAKLIVRVFDSALYDHTAQTALAAFTGLLDPSPSDDATAR